MEKIAGKAAPIVCFDQSQSDDKFFDELYLAKPTVLPSSLRKKLENVVQDYYSSSPLASPIREYPPNSKYFVVSIPSLHANVVKRQIAHSHSVLDLVILGRAVPPQRRRTAQYIRPLSRRTGEVPYYFRGTVPRLKKLRLSCHCLHAPQSRVQYPAVVGVQTTSSALLEMNILVRATLLIC